MPVITGAAKYPEHLIAKMEAAGVQVDAMDALALADSELLWFTVEAPGEIAPTIRRYAAGQRSTPQGGYTRGLYFRAV